MEEFISADKSIADLIDSQMSVSACNILNRSTARLDTVQIKEFIVPASVGKKLIWDQARWKEHFTPVLLATDEFCII